MNKYNMSNITKFVLSSLTWLKCNLGLVLLLSASNALSAYVFFKEYWLIVFIFREFPLLFGVAILQKHSQEFILAIGSAKYVHRAVSEENPLLKYDSLCFALGYTLFFFLTYSSSALALDPEVKQLLTIVAALLVIASVIITLGRVAIIGYRPELRWKVDIITAIRTHGFLSFATFSCAVVIVSNGVGRLLILVGAILVYPKIIMMDPDARGPFNNWLSSNFLYFGLQSKTEYGLQLGHIVKTYDPTFDVNGSDGMVDIEKCKTYLRSQGFVIR